MKKLSLVTAKVVRENEQYNYRMVGRGERYLVRHSEDENAGEKLSKYLTQYAKEPVVVEQVILQKNNEVIGELTDDVVFKATVAFIEVDPDTNKKRKVTRSYFVCADSIREAFDTLSGYLSDFLCGNSIVSIAQTKILEVL